MQDPQDHEALERECDRLRKGLVAVVALASSFLADDVVDREHSTPPLVVEQGIGSDRVTH